jgi:hypothetical protein
MAGAKLTLDLTEPNSLEVRPNFVIVDCRELAQGDSGKPICCSAVFDGCFVFSPKKIKTNLRSREI